MADEITLEFVLNSINKRIDDLQESVRDYHDTFVRFEEGKLTQALQDIEKSKGDILLLQGSMQKSQTKEEISSEKRKDWMWGALEKIIFMLIIPMIGLILMKLGIIKLN